MSLNRLKLGVYYDAVGHFNMDMKSSILIMINEKRVRKCLYRNERTNKLKRQSVRTKKTQNRRPD